MRCENSGSFCILAPACPGKQATRRVVITYNEVEHDVLMLCGNCAQRIARDARRHGYAVSVRPLT